MLQQLMATKTSEFVCPCDTNFIHIVKDYSGVNISQQHTLLKQIGFVMRPGLNKDGTNKAIMLVCIYVLLRRCYTSPLAVNHKK